VPHIEQLQVGVDRHRGLFTSAFCLKVWPISLRGSPWRLSGPPLEAMSPPADRDEVPRPKSRNEQGTSRDENGRTETKRTTTSETTPKRLTTKLPPVELQRSIAALGQGSKLRKAAGSAKGTASTHLAALGQIGRPSARSANSARTARSASSAKGLAPNLDNSQLNIIKPEHLRRVIGFEEQPSLKKRACNAFTPKRLQQATINFPSGSDLWSLTSVASATLSRQGHWTLSRTWAWPAAFLAAASPADAAAF
jgi:hypothetical protein